jgi:lipid A 3-O-deacylase
VLRVIPGILTILLSQLLYGQARPTRFTREISLVTDNDNYLLQKRDGYYTNGFYFSFQHLNTKKKGEDAKLITRYEIGQMIFNPYKYSITDPELMDRPFAGYLFVKASRSRFFQTGANFQYGLSVGVLGSASGAEEVQRSYHKLIHIYEVRGWGYQLKNEPGLNLQLQYSHPLTGLLKPRQAVDLHAIGKANAGNTFTNASAGLLLRIGLMENSTQSVAWNSRLHYDQPSYLHSLELFIFYQPEAMLQIYNATLQGGLFRNDKGPVTADIEPWLYQHRMGLMFARRRFSLALGVIHRTKEAKHMRRKENYGSILLNYRIK